MEESGGSRAPGRVPMARTSLVRWRRAVALLAAVAIGACGGGGSTAPAPVTKSIIADSNQSGWIWSGPTVPARVTFGDPHVGDLDADYQLPLGLRTVLGFNLATVPAGSHITGAILDLTLCGSVGSPIAKLGNVVVDHVTFSPPLDSLPNRGGTLTSDIGTIASDVNYGHRFLDVTSSVASDLVAARSSSQYRLRMANKDFNDDSVNDFVLFGADSSESGSCPYQASTVPRLTVTYTP